MQAQLTLAAIFADHMVLQRKHTIVIWGQALTGETVDVSLIKGGRDCCACATQANQSGEWRVSLPAQDAGGPYKLRINQADHSILLNDIMIGDVWLASGQSNMEWKLSWQVDNGQQDIAQSDNPHIRFFEVGKHYAAQSQTMISGSGWQIASPATSGQFSAVAWHFAKRYQQQTGIAVAIIDSTWGGTPAEAWTSLETLQHIPGYQESALDMLKNAQQWQDRFKQIGGLHTQQASSEQEAQSYKWKPGVCFNAMINPLIHFPIGGVLWYQGENNVAAHALYTELFKGLINDWRARWQAPELPFLFVQLASYLKQQAQPRNSDWALLREAQASALSLPNTAMAVTIDLGDAQDIHPRNKAPVGERLCHAARHLVLNQNVPYCGPVLTHLRAKNIQGKNVLEVAYQHIDGGLTIKGNTLLGFAIAGADGKFVNAQAQLEGDKVIVSSTKVKQPLSLRYAWADNSPANLYNKAGLPAVPFRCTVGQ